MPKQPVPRLLHQTWKERALPRNYEHWRSTFRETNPSLEHIFYDDADNRQVVRSHFPNLLPLYDSFEKEILRVDFVRPLYLFLSGGVYADLDFQCLRPFDELLTARSGVVLGRMGSRYDFPHSIPNALMMSSPREGFWLAYIANIEQAWQTRPKHLPAKPEHITGPVILRDTVIQYHTDNKALRRKVGSFIRDKQLGVAFEDLKWSEVGVLSSHLWYPLDWSDNLHQMFRQRVLREKILLSTEEARRLFPYSLAVTYWTHAWT